MGKYWVKIDEAVEGPYEGNALKFVDGFNEETLVSPDQMESEDIWLKAGEADELKILLGIQSRPKPAIEPAETITIEEEMKPAAEIAHEPPPEPVQPAEITAEAQTVSLPKPEPLEPIFEKTDIEPAPTETAPVELVQAVSEISALEPQIKEAPTERTQEFSVLPEVEEAIISASIPAPSEPEPAVEPAAQPAQETPPAVPDALIPEPEPEPVPAVTDDLLDVMAILNQEISNKKPVPVFEPAAVKENMPISIAPSPQISKKPARPPNRKAVWLSISALILTAAAVGIWYQWPRIREMKQFQLAEQWLKKHLSKTESVKIESLPITPQKLMPSKKVEPAQPPAAKPVKTSAPRTAVKPKDLKPKLAVKSAPAPVVKPKPAAVQSPKKPAPQGDLKSQKFLLPGVPAPNVDSKQIQKQTEDDIPAETKVSENAPAIPATEKQPSATPTETKKVEEEKPENSDKQFKDVEWLSQTQWGK